MPVVACTASLRIEIDQITVQCALLHNTPMLQSAQLYKVCGLDLVLPFVCVYQHKRGQGLLLKIN